MEVLQHFHELRLKPIKVFKSTKLRSNFVLCHYQYLYLAFENLIVMFSSNSVLWSLAPATQKTPQLAQ